MFHRVRASAIATAAARQPIGRRWFQGLHTPEPNFRELRATKELQEIVFANSANKPSFTSPEFMQLVSSELKTQDLAKKYSPHSISRILSNLGKTDYNDPILLDKFSHMFLDDARFVERFSPHDISLICSGFAALRVQDYILFAKLAYDIQHLIDVKPHGFNGSDLVRIAISFTQLRFGDPDLFEKLAEALLAKDVRHFSPSELSHIVRTFSTLGFKFPLLFQRISQHLASANCDLKQFNSRDLVMTFQSFARFGKPDEVLFDKLIREIDCRNMDEFDNKNIKAILWSLETLNFLHFDLFHKLWKEYDRRLPHDPYEF